MSQVSEGKQELGSPPCPPATVRLIDCVGACLTNEVTGVPLLLSALACGWVGWDYGSSHLPNTGACFVLAGLGGLVGVLLGLILSGAAFGAMLGWLVGWGLWTITRRVSGFEMDAAYWWPIYGGAIIGGLCGLSVLTLWSLSWCARLFSRKDHQSAA